MKKLIIGVAGGSASGKTTLAKRIYKEFEEDVVILSHDSYYKPHDDLTLEERSKINYDHPDSLDTNLLVQHIKDLKAGKSILQPTYNFAEHRRNDVWEKKDSAQLILVEGILIFTDKRICDLCDIKLFVDTTSDVRFIRRLQRDMTERGRTMESVISQYMATVKPMHEQFVEPSKVKADLIIPDGGKNEIAVSMILDAIRKLLNKEQK